MPDRRAAGTDRVRPPRNRSVTRSCLVTCAPAGPEPQHETAATGPPRTHPETRGAIVASYSLHDGAIIYGAEPCVNPSRGRQLPGLPGGHRLRGPTRARGTSGTSNASRRPTSTPGQLVVLDLAPTADWIALVKPVDKLGLAALFEDGRVIAGRRLRSGFWERPMKLGLRTR